MILSERRLRLASRSRGSAWTSGLGAISGVVILIALAILAIFDRGAVTDPSAEHEGRGSVVEVAGIGTGAGSDRDRMWRHLAQPDPPERPAAITERHGPSEPADASSLTGPDLVPRPTTPIEPRPTSGSQRTPGVASGGRCGKQPLLMPGKKTLYERVLTRPGARLAKHPDNAGRSDNPLIPALSLFYVYGRAQASDRTWLCIGPDARGTITGWVDSAQTVPWKQQIILTLTNRGSVRDRLLFFRDEETLENVLRSPDPAEVARGLMSSIAGGASDPRVVALEPDLHVDFQDAFYLLPVLDSKRATTQTGEEVHILKIASVSEAEPTSSTVRGASAQTTSTRARDYRAAIVFVIDSTISMGPYIDETKAAITRLYERLREAGVLDRVRFGLVAFRAESTDPMRNRQLGYVSQLYVNPSEVTDARTFLNQVQDLNDATTSTDHFDKDAFAGVMTALDETRWDDFDARYLILITDAGALDGRIMRAGGAPIESTNGLDARRIASIAGEKQVALSVFHLKSPAAAAGHRYAEAQYRDLARNAR
ncbi:vWA domain-containing protein, partial [Thiocapsa marina]|uniref:vWA domain-containing protein n=1 Tax=Thiocapsa marina TaxID=244573 RepID=UPI0018F1C89C